MCNAIYRHKRKQIKSVFCAFSYFNKKNTEWNWLSYEFGVENRMKQGVEESDRAKATMPINQHYVKVRSQFNSTPTKRKSIENGWEDYTNCVSILVRKQAHRCVSLCAYIICHQVILQWWTMHTSCRKIAVWNLRVFSNDMRYMLILFQSHARTPLNRMGDLNTSPLQIARYAPLCASIGYCFA